MIWSKDFDFDRILFHKENHYGVVTNTRIYDFVIYFAYEIKSCQNQNLCFQSFNSHSDKGFRKNLQSILASSMTSWGTLAQISYCWVTSKYGFLSMEQVRIILHTLLDNFWNVSPIALFLAHCARFKAWSWTLSLEIIEWSHLRKKIFD